MELDVLFPENQTCLIVDQPEKRLKTWRILYVDPFDSNRLRIWLLQDLASMAIDYVTYEVNDTVFDDEFLAARIGLIPITADPLMFQERDFEQDEPWTSINSLQFNLNVSNPTRENLNVTDSDLVWVPIGDQAERFQNNPPKVTYGNLLIAVLAPGQTIRLTAYAIRGTARSHAKFNSVRPISQPYIPTTTRPVPHVKITQVPGNFSGSGILPVNALPGYNANCPPCSQLTPELTSQVGFNCVNFTIQIQGGLTWQNILDQLKTVFSWGSSPPRNTLEQPKVPYIQV